MKPVSAILACLILILVACQSDTQSEYYGSLTNSDSGLYLTQQEHSFGWGRSDCLSCHWIENFHQDRPDRSPNLDMQAVRDTVTKDGLSSCPACHGANGVTGGN